MTLGFILVGLFILFFSGSVALILLRMYNVLIEVRNQVDLTWANIEVALKQRFEEIPQLIKVIEQHTQYESNLISELMQARSQFGSATSIDGKISAAKELAFALEGVMAIGEAYPELKSSESFVDLQKRISSLESRIADRRETFNEAVAIYNTRIVQFPDIIFAKLLAFDRTSLFEMPEIEKEKPLLRRPGKQTA